MTIRPPAVAGRFYSGSKKALEEEVRRLIPAGAPPRPAWGVVAPHAGYLYSGGVAGAVYAAVKIPDRVIILCPNHTGDGAPLAIMGEGSWRTPLGDVPIDDSLARELQSLDAALESDSLAHRYEHSLEVQLPFIQFLKGDFRFVPVCVGTSSLKMLLELGAAMAEAVRRAAEPVLLVASSDMTHYQPAAVARKKDKLAIDRMIALDPEGLYQTVRSEGISMCGYAPAVAVMQACRALGAQKGELARYATSGDVTGDNDQVVGYAGMIFL